MGARLASLRCPNEPNCGHFWHDIEDYDDPVPMCCEEGCVCGKTEEHKQLRRRLLYEATVDVDA